MVWRKSRPSFSVTTVALSMTDDVAMLESFRGVARLFPLPNLVLFPGVDQGLHIFEHRYRQMTTDALISDRLIALVLLRPDWEAGYDGNPAIESVACLGLIVRHERLIDGRYNLHVRGLARLAIDAEVPDDDKLYRLASGRLVRSILPSDLNRAMELRRNLREAVLARFDPTSTAFAYLAALFSSDAPLDRLCDQLGYCLPLLLSVKQQLLAEPDAAARADILTAAFSQTNGSTDRGFPPKFSSN